MCIAVVIENTIIVLEGRVERWNEFKSVKVSILSDFRGRNFLTSSDMNECRRYATDVVIYRHACIYYV
jgi:hypothetical protein